MFFFFFVQPPPKPIVRTFLLQESFAPNKTKLKETQKSSNQRKKEKSVFFLNLFLGWKTFAFVLTQESPHILVFLVINKHSEFLWVLSQDSKLGKVPSCWAMCGYSCVKAKEIVFFSQQQRQENTHFSFLQFFFFWWNLSFVFCDWVKSCTGAKIFSHLWGNFRVKTKIVFFTEYQVQERVHSFLRPLDDIWVSSVCFAEWKAFLEQKYPHEWNKTRGDKNKQIEGSSVRTKK